ncbi:MAG: hypothetical protein L6Q83_08960 [Gammaproteobacteria bacterium]|nr:hypothetical protein [Gammaproteobacteria bacterium]
MTRLWLRIFLGFWLVIAVAIAGAVAFSGVERRAELDRARVAVMRSALDAFALQAQQVLDAAGPAGLRRWLAEEEAERDAILDSEDAPDHEAEEEAAR